MSEDTENPEVLLSSASADEITYQQNYLATKTRPPTLSIPLIIPFILYLP